jgi:hypothetical protein
MVMIEKHGIHQIADRIQEHGKLIRRGAAEVSERRDAELGRSGYKRYRRPNSYPQKDTRHEHVRQIGH